MSNFRSLRVSKFRHVYGQTARRENAYEGVRITGSAHDSQFCAVNPKFIAVVLEVAGGGAFQVLPLKWTGKVDYHTGRVSGHNGVVNDLKWNPFNDNIIASCSDDTKIKLWYIPDGGVRLFLNSALSVLAGHSRRVLYLEWHPTVEGILSSAGGDCKVCLWNVNKAECFIKIDCHEDLVYSLAFDPFGTLLATTCKDRYLRIFDARTGEILQEAFCHEGTKASKVIFLGEKKKVLTTGFNRMSHRQIAIWNQNDISTPLLVQEIDTAPGVLFPFYDSDLSLLYIAGKGDGNIRYYEILESTPHLAFLSEFQSKFPQKGLGLMPKRGLDVSKCEIFRFYKIHASQTLVEPLSFIVPRKSERFQTDLYPPTPGPTPALTVNEWLCGVNKGPVRISLQGNFSPATNKPVQVKMAFDDDGHEAKPTLITSDLNNERKFQFLSEITKPDYRDITKRDDYSDLIKLQQARINISRLNNKLPPKLLPSNSFKNCSIEQPVRRSSTDEHEKFDENDTYLSNDDEFDNEERNKRLSTIYSRRDSDAPMTENEPKLFAAREKSDKFNRSSLCCDSPSKYEVDLRKNDFSAPCALGHTDENFSSNEATASSSSSAASSDLSLGRTSENSRLTTTTNNDAKFSVVSCPVTCVRRPRLVNSNDISFRSPQPVHSDKHIYTKPGRIAPGPLVHREPTPHIVRPFRVSQSQPPTPRNSNLVTDAQDSASTTNGHHQNQDSEIHKLYAQQSKRLREMMADLEPKDQRISQLERDLSSLALKLESLQNDVKLKDEDIESLRYEIAWKNKRISQLEQQLYDKETKN